MPALPELLSDLEEGLPPALLKDEGPPWRQEPLLCNPLRCSNHVL